MPSLPFLQLSFYGWPHSASDRASASPQAPSARSATFSAFPSQDRQSQLFLSKSQNLASASAPVPFAPVTT
jgi:hypothetical protein